MINFKNNLKDIISESSKFLKETNIINAKKELEWFCQLFLKFSIEDIHLKQIYLNKKEIKLIKNFINRRTQKEPFQYIVNSAPFLDYDFVVNSKVLIPRPETEIIFKVLKNRFFKTALDIGTGSGNIAISLKLKNIANSITAIDCDANALSVAQLNANNLNVKNIDFQQVDIFNYQSVNKYDLVVSNPPYISQKDYKKLPHHIRNHEPQNSLTDGKDGYSFYEYFANNMNLFLKPEGVMVLEIGLENTKTKIEKLFKNASNLIWHKDYNNNFRILEINA